MGSIRIRPGTCKRTNCEGRGRRPGHPFHCVPGRGASQSVQFLQRHEHPGGRLSTRPGSNGAVLTRAPTPLAEPGIAQNFGQEGLGVGVIQERHECPSGMRPPPWITEGRRARRLASPHRSRRTGSDRRPRTGRGCPRAGIETPDGERAVAIDAVTVAGPGAEAGHEAAERPIRVPLQRDHPGLLTLQEDVDAPLLGGPDPEPHAVVVRPGPEGGSPVHRRDFLRTMVARGGRFRLSESGRPCQPIGAAFKAPMLPWPLPP
jgi:hypothetical protein